MFLEATRESHKCSLKLKKNPKSLSESLHCVSAHQPERGDMCEDTLWTLQSVK